MPLPLSAGVTFDLYRAGNGPPSAPDIAGAKGSLIGRYRNLKTTDNYDHILLVDISLDIRYTDASGARPGDDIYFPDKNALITGGSRMKVWFVEVTGQGTSLEHKAAYLYRDVVQYPTTNL